MIKLLDCTLRDGGYYTNWDFDKDLVNTYIEATNILPIEYLEIGYRNNPSKEYLGKYGYCPIFELEDLRKKSKKKLAIMLNEKNVNQIDLKKLLSPIKEFINMIRLAVDPENFDRAVQLAESIKKMGFEVGFNTMYMSRWKEYDDFIPKLRNINGIADLFCMVDSYGGITPYEVRETISIIKNEINCSIGFHGHNNLELGLINSLTAIDCDIDYIDATILGMGRGAGNLKMELILTYLNKSKGIEVDFNVLGEVISNFKELHKKYEWGTNLPYMLSGINSLPQKNIMDWVNNRVYSFNSIVRALDNKREKKLDNAKYPLLKTNIFKKVLIIGGGKNSLAHLAGINAFIEKNHSIAIIHATSRYAFHYKNINVPQFYCLVGTEGKRLSKNLSAYPFNGTCILPPYPRIMGTDVPEFVQSNTFELKKICFTDNYLDSCTAIALQTALELKAEEVYMIGYDGYPDNVLSEKEMALTNENRNLFTDFYQTTGKKIMSLTPSLYKEIEVRSVYQYI
ncbi:aldolase catalytic domain-containing protein [Parabacteroides faecis]|uniref:4-hydroxy 2-oxovalerate aldolase n=1 Tax=Parabacteroides faecis TaxID=1217282 RepID=A0ABR6KIG3_9BACT|nr:aldolase catalytic domain-containing protein [Parabacteroides faecis]MBB4621128.1 4-hydroxy 2-oxovalerate aldolase [Parabacteroides faecis]GGJ88984.1 hypothetical protein GCM10007084_10840 [Parabacteroides faecis]